MDEGSDIGIDDRDVGDKRSPTLTSVKDRILRDAYETAHSDFYLNPRKPPPLHGKTTVYELLTAVLPRRSPYYIEAKGKPLVLATTKSPKPRRLDDERNLRCIVYAPDMFHDILAEAREVLSTPAMTINWENIAHRNWASGILPYYTGRRRATKVHSEKDIELAVFTMVFQPVVNVALAVIAGRIPTDLHIPPGSPYLSSAVQNPQKGAVNPDLLLIWGPGQHPKEDIKMRGEMKSRNVVQERVYTKSSKRTAKNARRSEDSDGEFQGDGAADSSAEQLSHGVRDPDDEQEEDDEENEPPDDSSDPEGEEGEDEGNENEEDTDSDDEEEVREGENQRLEDVDSDAEDEARVEEELDKGVEAEDEEVEEEPSEPPLEELELDDGARRHIFAPLQELTETYPLGYAAKFKWPTREGRWTKLTKVIMQVTTFRSPEHILSSLLYQLWEQLIQDKESSQAYNVLSSYDTTTFVVRKRNTLYISNNYTVTDDILLNAYCMVAVSLGLTKKKLKLPKANSDWWPEEVTQATSLPVGVTRQWVISMFLIILH